MITNTNNITLPLYIQKFIIKLLCRHINSNNKLIEPLDFGIDYRDNEDEIKRLILTIALVSKDWLKSLSNNLNVAVDFNFLDKENDNQFTIFKEENIKILKIHYDHEKKYFYKMIPRIKKNLDEIEIENKNKNKSETVNNNDNNDNNINNNDDDNNSDDDNDNNSDNDNDNNNINNNDDDNNDDDDNDNNNNNNDDDDDNNNNNNDDDDDNNNNNSDDEEENKKYIEKEISLEFVNKRIESLSKNGIFKKLLFRNINTHQNIEIIDQLYECEATDQNLQVLEFELNEDTTMEKINHYKKKIKKVFSIIINECLNEELIVDVFKNWSNDLNQFYIISCSITPFPIFQILAGIGEITSFTSDFLNDSSNSINNNSNNNSNSSSIINKPYKTGKNYLSNIQFFEIYGMEITFEELEVLITPTITPKLTYLSINLCFDKLMYFLATEQERVKLNIPRCSCCSLLNEQFGYDPQDQKDFDTHWEIVSNLLKNNKTLKALDLGHECADGGELMGWSDSFPTSFIEKVGTLVSSIPNLNRFILMGANCPQIFHEIVKQNKSIVHFESGILSGLTDHSNYALSLETLIENNPQIQSFNFSKFCFILENGSFAYKKISVFNFPKK
ncbi:hypothetical protein RB653_005474 [Dictyostelium firmibasis]|uniref:Uncharacterized protein n=1 Tax=Dictyostelium firmibasis TaxID=79012 RepID=A0AAN7UA91_9MYCE